MNRPLVIYHKGCMDGFAAACVVAKFAHERLDFHAATYGEPAPDCAGRDVCIVDFSYAPEVMRGIFFGSRDLVWLDHHETSRDLAREFGALTWPLGKKVVKHSDEACGATMAWAHFFGGQPTPEVLRYIEDRDLWRWELSLSREVSAGLRVLFGDKMAEPALAWDALLRSDTVSRCMALGVPLLREQAERVKAAVKRAEIVNLDGFVALATNSATDQSEIGEALCKEPYSGDPDLPQVGVVYWKDACLPGTPWVHSLRSRDGTDVSVIAKARGGGGHKAAAGFRAAQPIVEETK